MEVLVVRHSVTGTIHCSQGTNYVEMRKLSIAPLQTILQEFSHSINLNKGGPPKLHDDEQQCVQTAVLWDIASAREQQSHRVLRRTKKACSPEGLTLIIAVSF